MAYRITFTPSGREMLVEPGETILDAALREGIAVDYHCANGTCGDCRAQIIEGEPGLSQHQDYTFKGADKLKPMLLMCRTHPASDMILEAAEAKSTEDIPLQEIRTTVSQIDHIHSDVMVLHLRTPRSQTLRFLAGQYLSLQVGDFDPRNKSVASCPCNGRDLQFHFRRLPGDPLSEHLFESLEKRDVITITGPRGEFVLDDESEQPIILVAHETGFAPIKSLVEHAISLELQNAIHLYWVTKHENGHYLENYCRAWKDALDNFDFSLIHNTNADAPNVSLLMKEIIKNSHRLGEADIYATGPKEINDKLQLTLTESGADLQKLRFEASEYFQ